MGRYVNGYKTILEILEEGNFFAPPGGDDRDEEDIAKLRRAMELLAPGIIMACLLPYVVGKWVLVPFLGAFFMAFGAFRLWEENGYFRFGVLFAVVQVLATVFRLVSETAVLAWQEGWLYTAAGYAAVITAAAVPVVLTVGLWHCHKKYAPIMGAVAVMAVLLPLLSLLGNGAVMIVLRAVLAAVSAALLIWLLVRAKSAPTIPE